MVMDLIIGSHVSYKNNMGLLGSVKEAISYGANTFMFVNPYSDDESAIAGLTTEDRIFLKKILFQFAKVRAENNPDLRFDFTGINDPRLIEFIKKPSNHYFLVPLIKATNIRHTY